MGMLDGFVWQGFHLNNGDRGHGDRERIATFSPPVEGRNIAPLCHLAISYIRYNHGMGEQSGLTSELGLEVATMSKTRDHGWNRCDVFITHYVGDPPQEGSC